MTNTISKYVMLIVLICFLVIPKSMVFDYTFLFSEISNYLKPWYYQRLFLILILSLFIVLYCLFAKVKLNDYIILAGMVFFSCIQAFYSLPMGLYAVSGSFAALLLVRSKDEIIFNRFQKAVIFICFIVFPLQYLLYNLHGRLTASFIDANISGFYLFTVYYVFRSINLKSVVLFCVIVGALSLSRNFLLAVIVFEVFNFKPFNLLVFKFINKITTFRITLISLLLIMIISYLFVNIFSGETHQTGGTSSRMTSVVDNSNYNRFYSNIDFVNRITSGEFLITGLGNDKDVETAANRPHNAFFRSIYRYGLFVSLHAFVIFFIVFDKFIRKQYPFIISLFAYFSLLNDFITGPELFYLTTVLLIVDNMSNNKTNVSFFKRKLKV